MQRPGICYETRNVELLLQTGALHAVKSKIVGFYLYCSVFVRKVFLLRLVINQWIMTLASTNHA
jgi:hypothetical protein